MRRSLTGLGALLSLVLTSGCGEQKAKAPEPTGPDPAVADLMVGSKPAAPAGEKASAAEVVPPPPPAVTAAKAQATSSDVRLVDFAGLEAEVGKWKGKTVVIDCWATWCSICKEKFPQYLELQSAHADHANIVFAALANDPQDKADEVQSFLDESRAKLVCFLLDEDPADFAAHFQVDGVPAYLVYSPEGKLEFKAGKIEELKQELARRTAAAP